MVKISRCRRPEGSGLTSLITKSTEKKLEVHKWKLEIQSVLAINKNFNNFEFQNSVICHLLHREKILLICWLPYIWNYKSKMVEELQGAIITSQIPTMNCLLKGKVWLSLYVHEMLIQFLLSKTILHTELCLPSLFLVFFWAIRLIRIPIKRG